MFAYLAGLHVREPHVQNLSHARPRKEALLMKVPQGYSRAFLPETRGGNILLGVRARYRRAA